MRSILLTTDFSENSKFAITYALNLLADVPCNFYILHVVKSSMFISDKLLQSQPTDSIYQELIANAKTDLESFISDLKGSYDNTLHSYYSIVDYDNLVAAINQTITNFNISLIVTGTKGVTNMAKAVFGSNTLRVFQRCQVPVLAVPYNCPIKPVNKAVFTTSYNSAYKDADLKMLRTLATDLQFQVEVLHIGTEAMLNAEQKKHQQLITTLLKPTPHAFVFSEGAPFLKTVLEYVQDNDIDLFSMVRKQYSFLEHVFWDHKTEQVANNMKVPYLMLAN
ncbi:universal stress protein [Bizionia sediminis]|uniref:Universal stress protein n=1 Tax=Bizionia sediminis TaxID=1737064 RepID=A0ABW5KQ14_9FLAO